MIRASGLTIHLREHREVFVGIVCRDCNIIRRYVWRYVFNMYVVCRWIIINPLQYLGVAFVLNCSGAISCLEVWLMTTQTKVSDNRIYWLQWSRKRILSFSRNPVPNLHCRLKNIISKLWIAIRFADPGHVYSFKYNFIHVLSIGMNKQQVTQHLFAWLCVTCLVFPVKKQYSLANIFS